MSSIILALCIFAGGSSTPAQADPPLTQPPLNLFSLKKKHIEVSVSNTHHNNKNKIKELIATEIVFLFHQQNDYHLIRLDDSQKSDVEIYVPLFVKADFSIEDTDMGPILACDMVFSLFDKKRHQQRWEGACYIKSDKGYAMGDIQLAISQLFKKSATLKTLGADLKQANWLNVFIPVSEETLVQLPEDINSNIFTLPDDKKVLKLDVYLQKLQDSKEIIVELECPSNDWKPNTTGITGKAGDVEFRMKLAPNRTPVNRALVQKITAVYDSKNKRILITDPLFCSAVSCINNPPIEDRVDRFFIEVVGDGKGGKQE